jgi:hypothetical protein
VKIFLLIFIYSHTEKIIEENGGNMIITKGWPRIYQQLGKRVVFCRRIIGALFLQSHRQRRSAAAYDFSGTEGHERRR